MNHIMVKGLTFIEQKETFWISGVEICRNLDYANPRIQASLIWDRNRSMLENYSTVIKLITVDDKRRETRIYNEIGARFFISKCHMPGADEITMAMIQGFIQFRDEVSVKKEHRKKGRLLHRELTDQLQNTLTDEPDIQKHKFLYMNIAKNNCKSITGMSPVQLRDQRNVTATRDGLTLSESIRLSMLEMYQAEHLKTKPLTPKEAYVGLKSFSGRFIETLKQIE
jgi:hypothetical protein